MRSHVLSEIAIREAARRGDLDNLPGRGRPQDDEHVGLDEDARFEALLRRTTGGASLELQLRTEIAALRERLNDAVDDVVRAALKQQLIDTTVRLAIVHEANGHPLLANGALDFMPG